VPHLVKFLLRHALIGFAIGLAVVLAIVYQDLGHIGDLIEASSQRWLALALLSLGFGFTFGSIQMGFAIMLMPGDE
jgi:O-antigen/teichoic acid export membrane protein